MSDMRCISHTSTSMQFSVSAQHLLYIIMFPGFWIDWMKNVQERKPDSAICFQNKYTHLEEQQSKLYGIHCAAPANTGNLINKWAAKLSRC